MQPIILAAGKSTRFANEGYFTPKPFLEIAYGERVKTMLDHVIDTLPIQWQEPLVAVPEGMVRDLKRGKCVEIPNSNSQLETLFRIGNKIENDLPVVVLDSDVINSEEDILQLDKGYYPITLLTKKSRNPAYSYIDGFPEFSSIKEKVVISDRAVVGVWKISDFKSSLSVMQELLKLEDELYVSHFITEYLKKYDSVGYAFPVSKEPLDWGTPESLRQTEAFIVEKRKENSQIQIVR